MTMKHRHALAELIDETRQVNGWSDQDIVDRAESAGYTMSKANISRVRNSDVVAVNIGFVNALASGMGIPRAMIARAALASAGIMVDGGDLTIEDAIHRDTTLSLENKQTLRLMVQAMREAGSDAAPQKTGPGTNIRHEQKTDTPDTNESQKTGRDHGTTEKKTRPPGDASGGGPWNAAPLFSAAHDIGPSDPTAWYE